MQITGIYSASSPSSLLRDCFSNILCQRITRYNFLAEKQFCIYTTITSSGEAVWSERSQRVEELWITRVLRILDEDGHVAGSSGQGYRLDEFVMLVVAEA